MSVRIWEPISTRFCHYVEQQVALEAELVYPADILPDFAPRVLRHRCSNGMMCNQEDHGRCIWAGTNPTFDPFSENA